MGTNPGRTPLDRRLSAGAVMVAIGPLVVLAGAMLFWPEYGDQSLFVLGAQQLREGSVYYRDFWDIKQPGLYWFYQLGDLLIPGGLGARVLEAVLVLGAGLLVLSITRSWGLRRWVWLAGPTIVLGPYLIWSYVDGVGQVEGLMNGLLLAIIWLTWPRAPAGAEHPNAVHTVDEPVWRQPRARTTPVWAWFAAGLLIGVLVILKTLYAPLAAVPIAAACLMGVLAAVAALLRRIPLLIVGVAVPIAATAWYFSAHGVLKLALYTTFDLPSQVAKSPNIHPASTFSTITWALENMIPVTGPLALVALLGAWRRMTLIRDGALVVLVLLELALAYPQLATPYRYLMLAAPMGLLALTGVQSLADWLRPANDGGVGGSSVGGGSVGSGGSSVGGEAGTRWRSPLAAGLAVLTAVAALGLTALTLRLPAKLLLHAGDHQWGLSSVARIDRSDTPADFRAAALVAGQVRPGEQIYVVGDPSIMALLGAHQGLELTGWSLEQMPPGVWNELTRELARSRPALIYVDKSTQDWTLISRNQGKPFFDYLRQNYQRISNDPDGAWFQTTDVGQPLPAPGGNQLS